MKKTIQLRTFVMASLVLFTSLFLTAGSITPKDKEIPPFFNEIMKLKVMVKSFRLGTILMRTKPTYNGHIQIDASITSFKALRGFYYVQGSFGAVWDYVNRRPYIAWEDIYQGYHYQQRSYKFTNNQIYVKKNEKKYLEPSYPHSKYPEKNSDSEKTLTVNGYEYQDLLGSFYYMRTSGKSPNVGEVIQIKVLPAGSQKILYMKVIEKKSMYIPAFKEKRNVFHIKTGLLGVNKNVEGGDIFVNTTSPIDMYITDDEYFIPVLMSTKVPILGTVEIELEEYKNTN